MCCDGKLAVGNASLKVRVEAPVLGASKKKSKLKHFPAQQLRVEYVSITI